MKKNLLLFGLTFLFLTSFAQKSGFGFYYGKNWSFYRPGISNMSTLCNLYNDRYGTELKFNDVLRGNSLGFLIIYKYWQSDFLVLGRHFITKDEFIDPTTKTSYTLGLKVRQSSLIWGNALRVGIFAAGFGIELGNFNFMGKYIPTQDAGKTKWNKDFLGDRVIISKLFPNMPGYFFYFDIMPKFVGLRAYYSYPIGTMEYGDRGSLSFYNFFPMHWGFIVYLNYQIFDE